MGEFDIDWSPGQELRADVSSREYSASEADLFIQRAVKSLERGSCSVTWHYVEAEKVF